MSVAAAAPPGTKSRTVRRIIWVSLVALAVHLVPLFLPRNVPDVDLRIAALLQDAQYRIPYLEPLLTNPQSTGAHLREAAVLVLPASPPLARRFLAEAEKRAPRDVMQNQLLRARLCRADGDAACVTRSIGAARAAAPSDPAPDVLEADFAEEEGLTRQAVAALARAVEKSTDDVELALRYARMLGAFGRDEDAEKVFDHLRGKLPRTRFLVEHGLLELAQGEHQQAQRDFRAAVSADPQSSETHYYLGVALFRGGDWPRAEAELREADRLAPEDFRPLALLCALQREEGRLDDAAGSRALLDKRMPDQREHYDTACPP